MVKRITEEEATQRKQTLSELVGQPELLTPEQAEQLHQLLGEHHAAFCLEPNERGETDILSMEIDTGGAPPKKQAARRMPFAVKSEVSKQLRTMQQAGVIQPSNSSWASPVVMVRKRDRTHRFCVDYRELNSVTKADAFPLPRIDDHLDQLGEARYFTILDLTWYWQICMHPDSVEKTAFITSHEATGEKPSFLLFGFNRRTPTEAALLPPNPIEPTTVVDYRDQVILSLSIQPESWLPSRFRKPRRSINSSMTGRHLRYSLKGWRLGTHQVPCRGSWEAKKAFPTMAWAVQSCFTSRSCHYRCPSVLTPG